MTLWGKGETELNDLRVYACMDRKIWMAKECTVYSGAQNVSPLQLTGLHLGSGKTVHFVSINESSRVIFSPFLLLCTAADNQDEKCKSFHILFEDGMVQNPGRGKGLITEYCSHRKLVGLKTRINNASVFPDLYKYYYLDLMFL